MQIKAKGTFEVKLNPQPGYAEVPARFSLDKEFRGDLQGTSKGEMLTAMTQVKDSAGYVAIERITGALKGRKGSFVFQHSGTMARGVQHLTISVVPDSGTEELTGIEGTFRIDLAGGQHAWEFDYTLPDR